MTNDDRNNDDRTAEGQTPSWGQPQGDVPRYGERTAPGSAPQHDAQPRYGEQVPQQQYGQQQYGQQPVHSGAPTWQAHDEPKPKKKTVGRIALVVAFVALVLGVVGGFVLGNALGMSGAFRGILDGTSSASDTQQLQQDVLSDPAVRSQITIGSALMVAGTAFGLWAIVQGIIAIVTRRGRGWGVFALVLAVVAAIVAFAVYIGVAVASSGAAS